MLNKKQRTLRARIAAHARASKDTDPAASTAVARGAFLDSFYRATDPDLPEHIRQTQAEHAKKQYMLTLAFRSSVARSKRAVTNKNETVKPVALTVSGGTADAPATP